ncbi:hypothetical protein F751_0693 [Auxenochlorella protothecoides]|uniref:Uncharacterized protein n=1 Tax=Auxenochlorella protothecoides TaxID=3075 RepID=A0A087SQK3_AUXPR|nr:hypothetical protein F751_0693 [Auxenochlorella protothecoides]KFM28007.1 hypothetical protein F751_0693 [Auxenochlorella protothecoides]
MSATVTPLPSPLEKHPRGVDASWCAHVTTQRPWRSSGHPVLPDCVVAAMDEPLMHGHSSKLHWCPCCIGWPCTQWAQRKPGLRLV